MLRDPTTLFSSPLVQSLQAANAPISRDSDSRSPKLLGDGNHSDVSKHYLPPSPQTSIVLSDYKPQIVSTDHPNRNDQAKRFSPPPSPDIPTIRIQTRSASTRPHTMEALPDFSLGLNIPHLDSRIRSASLLHSPLYGASSSKDPDRSPPLFSPPTTPLRVPPPDHSSSSSLAFDLSDHDKNPILIRTNRNRSQSLYHFHLKREHDQS